MLHRYGRLWTFRLCMTCGKLMWPGQRALLVECGPNTENAYHRGRYLNGIDGATCAVGDRSQATMKQERSWHREVVNRAS